MEFINRVNELKELEEIYRLSGNMLFSVLVYGQRRIGKTLLVKKFITERKHLYFFVYDNKASSALLNEFSSQLRAEGLLEEGVSIVGWEAFFAVLLSRCEGYVVVFDEFQNYRNIEPAVFSIIQKMLDENSEKKMLFIFTGSVMGLIKKVFEDMQAPLYGRIKSKMHITPFTFRNSILLMDALSYKDPRDAVEFYSVFGGIPKYYVMTEDYELCQKNIEGVLENLLLRENAPLQDEVPSVLKQEFGSGKTNYYSILEAIACSHTKLNEISTCTDLGPTGVMPFLRDLTEHYQYVKRDVPVTEEWQKSRQGTYRLTNSFFSFWFRFIYKNMSLYEIGNYEAIKKEIKKELPAHTGKAFEDICREYLTKENNAPFPLERIGGWWHREREIDIAATSVKEKSILYAECKWKNLKKKEAEKIIEELKEKTPYVDWNNAKREEYYGIMAKKIEGKEDLREDGIMAYDLEDIVKR
ncbi:MAG: ATP-binding protein [Candidatus Altiarchaeia archaeon]